MRFGSLSSFKKFFTKTAALYSHVSYTDAIEISGEKKLLENNLRQKAVFCQDLKEMKLSLEFKKSPLCAELLCDMDGLLFKKTDSVLHLIVAPKADVFAVCLGALVAVNPVVLFENGFPFWQAIYNNFRLSEEERYEENIFLYRDSKVTAQNF